MTAHRKALDLPSLPGQREVEYIARRAQGGAGLLLTEASAVHPTCFPYEFMPTPYDRAKIPAYAAIATAVHAYEGAKVFGQVYHCGAEMGNGFHSEKPLWAPSNVRGWGSQEISHAMTKGEIDDVVEGFAQSARNLQEAGFDGVEVHGANGYLLQQFFSPMTNRREDEYGGSLENRMRFTLEVIAAIRRETGPNFPIGLKLCLEERIAGGLELDEGVEIAKRIDALDEIDYLCSTNGTHESRELYVPSGAVPLAGPARFYGTAAKEHVATPVMALGAVRLPEAAEEMLTSGAADLVGMLRALIADPDLPNRITEGTLDELRPCLGVNYCFRRATTEAPLRCAVNPAVGQEEDDRHAMENAVAAGTHVAVVGAGPAGLEAACTAAERGAQVVLYDAADEIGGAARVAAKFPGKTMNGYYVEYYGTRLAKARVDIRLGTRLNDLGELADVDVAVIATGAMVAATPWHDRNGGPGTPWTGPELFAGTWTELRDRDLKGKTIVLVESEPVDYVATTLAGYFIGEEIDLHIVTSFPSFGSMLDGPASEGISRRIAAQQIPVYAASHLLPSSSGDVVRLRHSGLKREYELAGVDLVVSTGARRSVLPTNANGHGPKSVVFAGDCVAPRGIAQAVREGHDVALAL
jgi:2,4-dienoyl-CoA reductase-like NADH-dependent reductase (Old Yellow Enzyme family)